MQRRLFLTSTLLLSISASHLFAQRKVGLSDIRVIEFDTTVFFKKISKTWTTYEMRNGDWISCVMKKGPAASGKLLGQMHDSIAVAKWDIKDLIDTIYLDTVLVCAENLYRVVAQKPENNYSVLNDRHSGHHTSLEGEAALIGGIMLAAPYMEAARIKSMDMTRWKLWN